MKKHILYTCLVAVLVSFSSCKTTESTNTDTGKKKNVVHKLYNKETFKIEKYSEDKSYGYTEENPIKVGGALKSKGPENERRFLNALAGPNGEVITYIRGGNCCPFETENGFLGGGLLDKYIISYKGLKENITLYINMYDSEELAVPVGFKLKY
ncbi:hypothetical protein M2132_000738 [Dysgonomonas sp. PH5-45]|uniref:hypothetical protein n=1 Tax=unclassified Dysgonomonas TaxID=2630389 RepID=UPI002475DC3E|nr:MULTISPECIES: hypothetical protein [unclassified Dysgonomonas]MDH6354410.1 hypothetical protein [Dysgonomonas sp. PH5-45]MDH6387309.1 hypothetical protein [Dysgonomonas sp. PH5-37]